MKNMNLKYFFNRIKWAWQRVFRGWDDRVAWDIGGYIAENIPGWIEKFKKENSGVPGIFFKKQDEYIDKNGILCMREETVEFHKKEYENVLDEIVKGFKIYNENIWLKPGSEEEQQFNKSFELFREFFDKLWN